METHLAKPNLIKEISGIFVLFFLLYASTITPNLSAAHDTIRYINCIDSRVELFHPHHLLYNATGVLWLAALRLIGVPLQSEILIPLLNALFGALTLCLFYRLLRIKLECPSLIAFVGTSLPAVSFGFWFYSTCIEVYIIPLFFILLSLNILCAKHLSNRSFALIGLTHGIGVLFHEVHIIFSLVIILAAILYGRRTKSNPLKLLLPYFIVFFLVTIIPYLTVLLFNIKTDSFVKAAHWLATYAEQPQYWHTIKPATIIKWCIGFSRSFIGGHFIFSIPTIRSTIENILRGKWLVDDEFLVRGLDKAGAHLLLGLSITLMLAVLILLIRGISQRKAWKQNSYFISLLCVWLCSYAGFHLFWEPSNVEFWIPQSLCFWLLFLTFIPRKYSKQAPTFKIQTALILSVIVLCLGSINYFGSIKWLTQKKNDYYYIKISELVRQAQKGDLIIIGRSWILQDYLQRETKAEILNLPCIYLNQNNPVSYLKKLINHTLDSGKNVFVSSEAINLEPENIREFGKELLIFDETWKDYKDNWQQLGTGISIAYQLKKKPS